MNEDFYHLEEQELVDSEIPGRDFEHDDEYAEYMGKSSAKRNGKSGGT